ncbi:hypothetical protein Trco_005104 [Trichoderma cornu-damae]|uniref:CHCH domain-containing protein n=1 Tax=Trichoderma cornu-damae TaxID=654480 RepID=A0A9P8QGU9_9HYPO|nr:hypothetical protein Trco_005104 [Trichoderma cornu-damae]
MPGEANGKPPATVASATAAIEDDDEPDEWDKRIFSTGCADENAKMTDCYYEKKDWRACAKEASFQFHFQTPSNCRFARIWSMEEFKECWKRHGNNERTGAKDN